MDTKKRNFIEQLRNSSAKEFEAIIDKLTYTRDLITKYPFESDPTYAHHPFITEYLQGFGFSFVSDGVYYLRTALGYLHYETTDRIALTQLAKIIAVRHNVTPDAFVRAIYHSIASAYNKDFQLFECFNRPWQAPGANEFIYRFLFYVQDVLYTLNTVLNTDPGTAKVFSYSAISSYMATFALPSNQLGYKYIREALHLMLSDPDNDVFNFHEVVAQLAKNFNASTDSIKSAMRRCVQTAYEDCPEYFRNLNRFSDIPLHCQFICNAAKELGPLTCSY